MASEGLRRARNEAIFREVNERVVDVRDGSDELEVLCECGVEDCTDTLRISLARYESVRADPTAFVIVPGHENLDVDHVRVEGPEFLIVTKEGPAGELAREHDPRG